MPRAKIVNNTAQLTIRIRPDQKDELFRLAEIRNIPAARLAALIVLEEIEKAHQSGELEGGKAE